MTVCLYQLVETLGQLHRMAFLTITCPLGYNQFLLQETVLQNCYYCLVMVIHPKTAFVMDFFNLTSNHLLYFLQLDIRKQSNHETLGEIQSRLLNMNKTSSLRSRPLNILLINSSKTDFSIICQIKYKM